MTTTPPDLDAARAELTAALKDAGWSYLRAMCKFHWQMNWNPNWDPTPPAMEKLSGEQLFHLTCLIRDNVKSRP